MDLPTREIEPETFASTRITTLNSITLYMDNAILTSG